MSNLSKGTQEGKELSREWIRAHLIWGTLGWGIAACAGITILLGVGLIFAGGIVGAFAGAAQWSVLRRRTKFPGWEWSVDSTISSWTIASSIGGELAWVAYALTYTMLPRVAPQAGQIAGLIAGCMAGILYGSTQWLMLRRNVSKASLWIMANSAGLAFGGTLGNLIAMYFMNGVSPGYLDRWGHLIPLEWYGHIAIAGAISITFLGAITGPILAWLYRNPSNTPARAPHTPAQPISGTEA